MAAPLDKDPYELDDNEKIASNFYNRNFGTMAKSDFEILLFSCYIEHCLDKNLPFDDYTLAEKLGITPSRISSLKLKKELKYPRGEHLFQQFRM
jgi:hypothetical protein